MRPNKKARREEMDFLNAVQAQVVNLAANSSWRIVRVETQGGGPEGASIKFYVEPVVNQETINEETL